MNAIVLVYSGITIQYVTMLIPIRCFTCGKVLADKWLKYVELRDNAAESSLHVKGFEDNHKGVILDELGISRICCRRIFLTTNNDLIDII